MITFWNRGAERTYGFTRAEAVGRVASELLRTEYPAGGPGRRTRRVRVVAGRAGADPPGRAADRAGQPVGGAAWRRTAPGSASMEVNRDITAARDAERYARSLIEASQDPLLVISPDGDDHRRQPGHRSGRPACRREEIIGTDFAGYFTAPDRARDGVSAGARRWCPRRTARWRSAVPVARSAMCWSTRRCTGTPPAPCSAWWPPPTTSPTGNAPNRNERSTRSNWNRPTRAGPVEHRAGPVQRRAGAVRLRRLARPVRAVAGDLPTVGAAGPPLPRAAGRAGRRVHRLRRRRLPADAEPDRRAARPSPGSAGCRATSCRPTPT